MQNITRLQGILCLLSILLTGSAALAQTANVDAGKAVPMRRAPELTALVDAKTAGYFVMRDQTQTIREEAQVVVNFEKEMLLAAVMGASFTGDGTTGIKITEAREFADRLVVMVKKNNFVPGDYDKNAMIFPLDVVSVPISRKPVYFHIDEYTGKQFIGPTTIYLILRQFTGPISKVNQPTTLVITDMHAWQALWKDTIGATPPTLTIDFAQQMAVAIFLGSGQEDIVCFSHVQVSDDGKTLTVRYSHQLLPAAVAFRAAPYLLLVIPASKLPVTFQDVPVAPTIKQPSDVREVPYPTLTAPHAP